MSDPRFKRFRAFGCALVLTFTCLIAVAITPTPAAAVTVPTQVSAGGESTCAVMSGGSAYCWGDNTDGQLGNGTTTPSATPVLVSGSHTWASISTSVGNLPINGTATTCAVTTLGAGYCWGGNYYGTSGDGSTSQSTTPVAVSGGYTWASISVGWLDVCGLTTTNVAYCWGANQLGEIGDGSTAQRNSPSAVSGGLSFNQLAAGTKSSCGVTTIGTGYCWVTTPTARSATAPTRNEARQH